MSDQRDRREAFEFERYWDALASGRTAQPSGDLDPAAIAAAKRLRALGNGPAVDPARAASVWEEIMHAHALQPHVLSQPAGPISTNGRVRPRVGSAPLRPIATRPVRPLRQPWWQRGASIIGVAALIVAMIGGIFFTFREPNEQPSTLPAVVASPSPIATPATPAAWVPPVSVWTATGGAKPFTHPSAIAIDPSGNVWVNDASNTFQIFDPNGAYLESWGAPGSGDGQFNFLGPHQNVDGGIVFAPDGGFYVLDTGNVRVQKFDRTRRFVAAWGTQGSGAGQFIAPIGIAIDKQGQVYVEDELRDDVQIFDGGGKLLRSFRVHASFGVKPGEPDTANAVSVDVAGNIYVTSSLRQGVLKFDPSGKFIAQFGRGGYDKGQFLQPGMVAFDGAGNLLVTDVDNNRVDVLAPNGQFLASWGQERRVPGSITGPAGIAVHGDFVYLTEWKGNRIHAFRLSGPFPAPAATPTQ